MNEYKIRRVENGYIFHGEYGNEKVYKTLDELLNHLLLMFEGRSEYFKGDSWGRVVVDRIPPPSKC